MAGMSVRRGRVVLSFVLLACCGAPDPCGFVTPSQCRQLAITCRALQLQFGHGSPPLPPACQRVGLCCAGFNSYIHALTTPTYRRLSANSPALQSNAIQSSYRAPVSTPSRSLTPPRIAANRIPQLHPSGSSLRPNKLSAEQRPFERPVVKSPAKLLQSPPRQQLALSEDTNVVTAKLPAECGVPGPDAQPRSTNVGERDADPARWPWMVLLGERRGRDDSPQWTCGAVLVTRAHVLTAAHCVRGQPAHRFVLRVGEYDLSTRADGREQDVDVRTATIHPAFRRRHDDVAVLQLATPVQISDRVRPICLPPPQQQPEPSGDLQPLWVAGWGRESFLGNSSDVLQEAHLRAVPSDQCELTYRRLPDFERAFPGGFNGTKVCAADPLQAGADACMGDSGGPLVTMRRGRYQLVGLVSVGVGCGDPQFPGVYTRIGSYVDWVLSVI